MQRLKADLLLLFAAAVWGSAFYFQKTAMDHVGPFLFIGARAALAALCLAPLALREAHEAGGSPPRRVWIAGLCAGLAFFVAAALQQEGLITATVTNAGFLTALYVIATPIIAWVFLGRLPALMVWPAIILAFSGAWLLGGGTLAGFSRGDGLIALSAFVWGAHLLITSAASPFGRPVAFTTLQFAIVAIAGLMMAVMLEPVSLDRLVAAAPAIAYVGILSSAVTFTLLAVALKSTPPNEAAILVSTETLFAAAAGVILLGERLAPISWVGAGFMFAATLLVQIGPMIERRQKPRPVG
jgi:drug/metabolite transporter (DMT)-like permease